MIVTLQLQGGMVHIALARADEKLEYCDRVKVYAPGSSLVFDERNKRLTGTISLAPGATMHIDAYGEKGEGQLISQDYQRDETGLVPVQPLDDGDGIRIVVAEQCRFYAEQSGASWCVRDSEILTPFGPSRGKPMLVEWCSGQSEAEGLAQRLNETRGHASDEPKCVNCGAQPAGPAGSEHPMCASCHSRLADLHG